MALMARAAGKALFFVCASTIAEFYRGGGKTAAEARLLNTWRPQVISIHEDVGRCAGELLARTGGANSMDALVVAAAMLRGVSEIFTTDLDDIEQLVGADTRAEGLVVTKAD